MFIRDSRRSYRTCATEFNLFGGTHRYHRTYTGISEHILVLQNLYWSYGTYTCISDTEVPVGTTKHFTGTKVPVVTTEQIPYTEVLVGTTGLILILRIRDYS